MLYETKCINHNILNAKHHLKEAGIIARAGQINSVTLATNMAGRGTDIKLGGSTLNSPKKTLLDKQEVVKTGGLFIIGTERHESRRVDNQLRGRAGRQGDPGESKFFLSLEDDLMRIFGSNKIAPYLTKLGLKKNESIEHPWINKSIIKAQRKVESKNYEIRKSLLQFDDVLNDQRHIIYAQRLRIIEEEDLYSLLQNKIRVFNRNLYHQYVPRQHSKNFWRIYRLETRLNEIYQLDLKYQLKQEVSQNINRMNSSIFYMIANKKRKTGHLVFNEIIRKSFLFNIDFLWKEHLHLLEHIKTSINLRAYGQKEPLSEYKLEAFQLFRNMFTELEECVINQICTL